MQKSLFDLESPAAATTARSGDRRKSYARITDVHPLPRLVDVQLQSFQWFTEQGLRELFEETFPIKSYNGKMSLELIDYRFEEPTHSEQECRIMDMTYSAPLHIRAALVNEQGERLEQDVYMGNFPLMTDNATFIVNGAERVVVSQLIRSSGIFFTVEEDRKSGRQLCLAKLIPSRGAWLEFETTKKNVVSVKVDRKRKIPVTVLVRALAAISADMDDPIDDVLREGTDEELFALFERCDNMPERSYIEATIEKDPTKNAEEAVVEFFRRMRPGDPPNLENAKRYLESLLFSSRRYDLAKVGRYKLNKRLELSFPLDQLTLTKTDLIKVVERMILINNGVDGPDDIDALGNRRVKTVGELIQNQLRIGFRRMEQVVRERMSTKDPSQITPLTLINIRPVVAAVREFFGGSQLSQFMDQTNPLAELTHKRRLSALGPGGLRRERAGFDVRDVHDSHYGRICPIETPEGPNIGLIGSLATYAEINEYGFIETPYRKVMNSVPNDFHALLGKTLREDVVDPESREVIATAGTVISPAVAELIVELPLDEQVPIRPIATNEIVYMPADEEEKHVIAQANAKLDERGQLVEDRIEARSRREYLIEPAEKIDMMDVSPKQIVSVSAALIPFLEHDDANRALMGSNMQRQAVPLVMPKSPTVGTGMERQAALDSGQVLTAREPGRVVSVSSQSIVVRDDNGDRTYDLRRHNRSNQGTCIDQRPTVHKGDYIQKGDVLADSSSTENGELALGQNVLVAFLSWEGQNFEDAVVISESLVRDDKFSSVHIEKHEIQARSTKLGPEEITRDIPNVGEEALKNLDEEGVICIGAEVKPGDVLVGKITPKGETDLTPEEKLLRAIFGEKAREVKDSSLRLPHGERGKVVYVRTFTREDGHDLPAGVEKLVRVSTAHLSKVTEGDKLAGRHGNKGVISKVVPVEDMPFMADGTPIEIILNPLGVPSRMNIGQILETHLGWAADRLGFKSISPVFDGADEEEIVAELARAWLIDWAWNKVAEEAWQWLRDEEYEFEDLTDDDEARTLYLTHLLGDEGYDVEALMSDRRYARRSVLEHTVRKLGYDPGEFLVLEDDRRPVPEREKADRLACQLCLRLWLEELGYSTDDVEDQELERRAGQASLETGQPIPTWGKMILYDGRTGEPFDHPVTVGTIYIMKLAHLVEDKVHARSTGPYSLVTQQPLGGKAQFGGQRFGEMEVWALEAYGAAHTLQEMLTVKSDDVTGRVQTYQAIVKGTRHGPPGIPESFRVLVKELQSLGLSVEVIDGHGKRHEFGKDDVSERDSRLRLEPGFPSELRI
ncbi:MAG: DNA-directed RNA polymerase subunit beta [Anaerolineae bacterium]|nr:DNA-directed RNA polymerase subunit beta [Anaerolineae bacterium]NIN94348.1 DNA-directed RNA polymerase subunit beta [Anaerolineae bacterium]NIQ77411.1 DNA-directed RNA polymerase subunit beta [Anaerolineae bacterium]